jgi:hypothetical protein
MVLWSGCWVAVYGPWTGVAAKACRGTHRMALCGMKPRHGGARRWSGSRRSSPCALVAGSMKGEAGGEEEETTALELGDGQLGVQRSGENGSTSCGESLWSSGCLL